MLDSCECKHPPLVKDVIQRGEKTDDSKFAELLIKNIGLRKLAGKCIKDKRGGASNIHSWDIELKGSISKEQKVFLNLLLKVLIPLIMRTFCWSLVKNMENEGKNIAKIKERARTYMHSENVQRALRMRGTAGMLWKLPSFLQAVFYSGCMVLIRWKWSGFVALMFYLAYPIMKKYIFSVLK